MIKFKKVIKVIVFLVMVHPNAGCDLLSHPKQLNFCVFLFVVFKLLAE